MEYISYQEAYRTVPQGQPIEHFTTNVVPQAGPGYTVPMQPIVRRYELGTAEPKLMPESTRYDAAARGRVIQSNLYEGMARVESLSGPPRTHTVIRTPGDTMESEIRSELSILRHQIYELRDRTHPRSESHAIHYDQPPYPEDLRREFEALQTETRQIKRELADLRQQISGAGAHGFRPPREPLPSREVAPPPPPPVPVMPVPQPVPRPQISSPRGPTGSRATLGVEVKQRGDLLVVHRVSPGGPCDLAGVRPGDVLRRWEGYALNSKATLERLLSQTAPGSVVLMAVQRYGRTLPVKVIIGGPSQPHPPHRDFGTQGRGAFEPLQPTSDGPRGRVLSLPSSAAPSAAPAPPKPRSASRERSPVRTRRYYSEETEGSGRYDF